MSGFRSILALLGALLCAPAAASDADPRAIIDRVDRILRGDSSRGVATMEVVTRQFERTIEMEIWSLGTDYSLVRIKKPRKEAGIATLKAANDIWNYLPKVDRTIKIPASMMAGSWMGSHFTNDDLVKESRLVEDFEIELAIDGEDSTGTAIWGFTLTPNADAAVVWGRIEYVVRQADSMPLRAAWYDEDGRLARTMVFGEFREFGGRLVPGMMQLHPADEPGERTTVRYEELEFDMRIAPSFFSLRNLKRRW